MTYSRLRQKASLYHRLTKLVDEIDYKRRLLFVHERSKSEELSKLYIRADKVIQAFKRLVY